jgi:hypothetical protein
MKGAAPTRNVSPKKAYGVFGNAAGGCPLSGRLPV